VVPGFLAPLAFDVGPNPSNSVAVGDFAHNGRLDLAVAGVYGSEVSVLLGNGDGTFQVPRNYNVGVGPTSLVVGDFTGTGVLDLAMLSGGGVTVLPGNGDGTFQAARHFSAGSDPDDLAVGDFTGTGVLDLVVADRSNGVSVLLGNGDGTFQPPQTYMGGTPSGGLVVGDFTGTGVRDLAVITESLPDQSERVSVLLGNGDGTFQAPQNFSAGPRLLGYIAAGDFNRDGHLDLAVTNPGISPGDPDAVSVLLGNGDGTFQAPQSYSLGTRPASLAVGDFTGTGVLDLVVSGGVLSVGRNDGNRVSVLLGNGDGTFQAPRNYSTGAMPTSLAVGDFTGTGVLDLAVTRTGPAGGGMGSVAVLLGNGDGTFQEAPTYGFGGNTFSVAVGDFTGTGIQDLAVSAGGGGRVNVLLGNGDGTFQAPQNYSDAGGTLVTRDFDGDGNLDLAGFGGGAFGAGGVGVLLGNGDGTFQPARNTAVGNRPNSVAVGDFARNGRDDLAVSYQRNNGVSVLLSNGDGTFQTVNYTFRYLANVVAVGDFDGDGTLDLVGIGDSGGSLLLGNGDGTFRSGGFFSIGDNQLAESIAVGDFTGNGRLDLAVLTTPLTGPWTTRVSVLLGNGDGTFQAGPTYGFAFGPNSPTSLAVGDFKGDGVLGLALTFAGGVRVWLGNGDGTFQTTPISYVAGSQPTFTAVGDFNGDGRDDLAVANGPSNDVSILLNDGSWPGGGPGPRRAPGGGRVGGALPIPAAAQAPPSLSVAEWVPPDFGAATVSPLVATVPVGDDGLPPPGADAAKGLTAAAPAVVIAPARTPAGAAARWLLDRLFAEPDSGWLWDGPAY
jgi:hypothetical protein